MQLYMWQHEIVGVAHYIRIVLRCLVPQMVLLMMHQPHLPQPWWLDRCISIHSFIHPRKRTWAGCVSWLLCRLLAKCLSCTSAQAASSFCCASRSRPSGVAALRAHPASSAITVPLQGPRQPIFPTSHHKQRPHNKHSMGRCSKAVGGPSSGPGTSKGSKEPAPHVRGVAAWATAAGSTARLCTSVASCTWSPATCTPHNQPSLSFLHVNACHSSPELMHTTAVKIERCRRPNNSGPANRRADLHVQVAVLGRDEGHGGADATQLVHHALRSPASSLAA